MTLELSALLVPFEAFCIWLTVRIVNRWERWAKRPALVMLTVLVGYPLSLGPVCWVTSRTNIGVCRVSVIYQPMFRVMSGSERALNLRDWYTEIGASYGWSWHPRPYVIPRGEGKETIEWIWIWRLDSPADDSKLYDFPVTIVDH